jgi:4-hydroxy-4-methyl-2-oxoglutarate aldolase
MSDRLSWSGETKQCDHHRETPTLKLPSIENLPPMPKPPDQPGGQTPLTLAMLREHLTVPLLCDALDAHGYSHQSPRLPIVPLTTDGRLLAGRAKTMLWADMAHEDPNPYALELAAIDSCQVDSVCVCAAAGSGRSGIWGELLTTAARNRGCIGVIVDGAVRDTARMRAMEFPVFARGTNPYDSRNRQRVIDFDIPVELDGVRVSPGDLIAADIDGIVIVPQAVEHVVLAAAWAKVHAENQVRDAIVRGMSATEAFRTFGVL